MSQIPNGAMVVMCRIRKEVATDAMCLDFYLCGGKFYTDNCYDVIHSGPWQYGFGTLWHELTTSSTLWSSATAAFGITEGDERLAEIRRNHRLLGYWYDTYEKLMLADFVTQVEDVFIPMYTGLSQQDVEEQIFAWIEWFTVEINVVDVYEGYTYEEGITAAWLQEMYDCINTERLFTLEHYPLRDEFKYTAINVCIEVFTLFEKHWPAFAKNELKDNPQWTMLKVEVPVLLNLTPQFFEALKVI
ncbi:hypothetical protein SPFM12_00071 [Salmonella phage SPFM12]|nr:hypothetical protein SPFM12_00071 [Salmonella phage SPFM12]